jgi:protein SCO1/2
MKTRNIGGFASRSTILVLIAALAAGLGLFTAQRYFGTASSSSVVHSGQLKSVQLITPPRELADYRLTFSDGKPATPASLRGSWTIVFLGFTHCPDVCPTTLAELAKAQKSWETMPAPMRPRVLFVSVDPERDSPARTGEYAHFFRADTLAASGDADALANFAQVLGLVFMKVPLDNGDYSMDHSATLVVLDPQGRQAGLIRPPLVWSDIASDLRSLAESGR